MLYACIELLELFYNQPLKKKLTIKKKNIENLIHSSLRLEKKIIEILRLKYSNNYN